MRLISAIIPSLHRPDLTAKCIESLQTQTLGPDQWEAIVVENEAQLDSILPDPLPSNVKRILLKSNLGTTGSINRGVASSSSEYVLLLNNDVVLAPDFLEHLVSAMRDLQCGFATGKLRQGHDTTLLDGSGDALLLGGGAYRLGHGDPDLGQFERKEVVLCGCGAATLFRRSAFNDAQGLDEDFFAYLDDMDLALRVRMTGLYGVYVPEAVAYHLGSATLGYRTHPRIIYLLTRNQFLLVLKNYPIAALLQLLPQILIFQLLWLGLAVRRGWVLPYLQGVLSALRCLPRTMRKRTRLREIRRITDSEFIAAIRTSEKQVSEWQRSLRPPISSSRMLRIYFWLFGG